MYVVLKGGITLSFPEKFKTFEDIANYRSIVGSSYILRDKVFLYTYPYTSSSFLTEYTSDSLRLFQPSFLKPVELSLGTRVGGSYLQVDHSFWGSYTDKVGDYQVYMGKISYSSYSSVLREYTVSLLYSMFQRSAYIGRYPYGDTVFDFYEKWIYFGNFGVEFTSRGDLYRFFSGFSYNSVGIPVWVGFSNSVSGYNLTFRQISFLATSTIPVRSEFYMNRTFIRGKSTLSGFLFVGYVFSSENLSRGLILENNFSYTRFMEMGSWGISLRWFVSRGGEMYGFETLLKYEFATRFRPEIFVGYLYPNRVGFFGGISINMFRKNVMLAYDNTSRSIHLGMEVSHAKFSF